MLTVGVFAYLDRLAVPGVLAAAFLAALGGVFYSPAVSTLMLDIIPHDDMVRGQSIHSGLMSMIDMVGTAFSGAMVAFFGVPLIVVLNGLSNLYSALSELFIRVPRTVQQGEKVTVKGLLVDSRQAVREIFSDRFLRLFVPSALIINLLSAGPLSLMLPFCLEKGFAVEQYGYLMAVGSAAYAACVILLGIVKLKPKVRFWLMSVDFIASSVFIIFGYLSVRFLFVCVWAFGFMFLNAAGNTIFNASMMLALPEENRGAILGFIRSASVGGTALSAVIYGFLGDVFPLYLVFTVGSALSLVPMLRLCLDKRTREFVLNH
jgi:MFS family permease